MRVAFLWNLLGWTVWGLMVLTLRYQLERRRQHEAQQASMRVLDAAIEVAP